jgi:hypothetical protein
MRIQAQSTYSTCKLLLYCPDPQISLGQDGKPSISITVEFLLPSEQPATNAKVALFPRGKCGVGSKGLNGTGSLCSDENSNSKCSNQGNGQVKYTASYTIAVAGTL